NSKSRTVTIKRTKETRSRIVIQSFPTTLFHILFISYLKLVTYAPNGDNHLSCRFRHAVQFFTQALDMCIDSPQIAEKVVMPDFFQQMLPVKYLIRCFC